MSSVENSENKNQEFDNMSIDELEELLDHEIESIALKGSDSSYASLLMEVIDRRLKIERPEEIPDSSIALERFKKDYLPHVGYFRAHYDWDPVRGAHLKQQENDNVKHSRNPSKDISTRHISLRKLGIAAAVLIIMSALLYSVGYAFNWPHFRTIFRTREESFGYVAEITPKIINSELESLHTALKENGVTVLLAPTWIPDGFKLEEAITEVMDPLTLFVFCFREGDRQLMIQISAHEDMNENLNEMTAKSDVKSYVYHGREHRVTENEGRITAVWVYGKYECAISGDVTVAEMERIIDSIYER